MMKKLIPVAALILVLSGCSITFDEPFDDRNRYTGRYDVEEYSQTTNEVFRYSIRIRKSLDFDDEVIIENFYDAGIDVFAFVDGNKIFINPQIIGDYEVEGVGTRVSGDIEIDYTVRYLDGRSNFTDFLSATAFK